MTARSKSRRRRESAPSAGGPPTPFASPADDARRLKRHLSGSAEELRAFLDQMRGRSAREMLGAVAESSLVRSTVQAAVGAALLVAILTVLPFAWSKWSGPEAASRGATGSDDPADSGAGAPDLAPSDPPAAPASPAAGDTPELPATTEALEALGIGQEKAAPADVNPLEGATDDLLEDLD